MRFMHNDIRRSHSIYTLFVILNLSTLTVVMLPINETSSLLLQQHAFSSIVRQKLSNCGPYIFFSCRQQTHANRCKVTKTAQIQNSIIKPGLSNRLILSKQKVRTPHIPIVVFSLRFTRYLIVTRRIPKAFHTRNVVIPSFLRFQKL